LQWPKLAVQKTIKRRHVSFVIVSVPFLALAGREVEEKPKTRKA
jgi:hypothetical protein